MLKLHTEKWIIFLMRKVPTEKVSVIYPITAESVLCKLIVQYAILISVTKTYQFIYLMQQFTNFFYGQSIFIFSGNNR